MDRKKIDELDAFDKLRVYLHYYSVQIGLKYRFEIVDKAPLNPARNDGKEIAWSHGRGKPDKDFGNIALYYLWKDQRILSFEDFSKDHIYEWHWRFEEEISRLLNFF